MGLVTNLKLLDARGKALSDFEVAVHLNGLVHALPWQSESSERCITTTPAGRRARASRYQNSVRKTPKGHGALFPPRGHTTTLWIIAATKYCRVTFLSLDS